MNLVQILCKFHWNILEFNIAYLFKLVLVHGDSLVLEVAFKVLVKVDWVTVLHYAPTQFLLPIVEDLSHYIDKLGSWFKYTSLYLSW